MHLFQRPHRTNRFNSHPFLEKLEDRSCPSTLPYDIIAKAGDLGLTGMGDNPSINDAGRVAFVGQFSDGQGLVVGDGTTQGLRNINPTFSHSSTRMFDRGAFINNQNLVLATDQVSGNPPQYLLRTWNADATDSFTLLARGGLTSDPYDAILYAPAFNNVGGDVFPALRGSSVLLVTQNPSGTQTFSTPQAMRPQMDDRNDVVVRAGNQTNSPILLYGPGLTSPVAIASPAMGFTRLGSSPGISHNGQIVTFYAEDANGPGIFASINTTSRGRVIQKIAGLSDGFQSFSADVRVAVNSTQASQQAVSVVFLGTNQAGTLGIYSSRLTFVAQDGHDFDPDDPGSFTVGPPTPIVEVGDTINGLPGTVQSLNNDGEVTNNGEGQIAFFVVTSSTRAIVRAPLSDIVVDSVKTTDSRQVTVTYDVYTDGLADKTFQIGIFQSPTQAFDQHDNHRIDSIDISGADAHEGHHRVSKDLASGIGPYFSQQTGQLYHYVDAVADPDGMLAGFTIDNSQGYFHQYVIGAVSVGFKAFEFLPDDWVKPMAASLQAAGYDGTVIPFHRWGSGAKDPNRIIQAGQDLSALVMNQVSSLTGLRDNDVIDVHLIGHSRGSVVISEAMINLLAADMIPQLAHGYLKMTLLDPHPANNDYGLNADFDPGSVGTIFQRKYTRFQDIVHDPAVVVPSRVNQVEIFWQHTPAAQFSGYESYINLWGLDPIQIQIQGSQTQVDDYPLTGEMLGGSFVGHTEVHAWYQTYFIPGGNRPATSTDMGTPPVDGLMPATAAIPAGPGEPSHELASARAAAEFNGLLLLWWNLDARNRPLPSIPSPDSGPTLLEESGLRPGNSIAIEAIPGDVMTEA